MRTEQEVLSDLGRILIVLEQTNNTIQQTEQRKMQLYKELAEVRSEEAKVVKT
jgi:hypothetical protein